MFLCNVHVFNVYVVIPMNYGAFQKPQKNVENAALNKNLKVTIKIFAV